MKIRIITLLLSVCVLNACSSADGYRYIGDKKPAPQEEQLVEE